MKKNALLFPHACRRLMFLLSLTCLTGVLFGQQRQITGKVLANDNDSTVTGATITVKGRNTSTITGADGSFTLSVAPNSTLVISSIGFLTQEVPLGNKTSINVRLTSTQQSIQQVVVIGYCT
ncbi:MAG TPA: carboxypeptidase-like regulatory domain-containing protein, partial [Puia sp.]|nr:carboxypeptidase-like regulatory domain-containing protein [Puia sp.]